MSNLNVSGKSIPLTDEGFLQNPNDWDKDVAEAIAKGEEISLTDKHWNVIELLQEKYKESGELPTLRRLSKDAGLKTKDMYDLFPQKPLIKAAKIAGLPKPTGCG